MVERRVTALDTPSMAALRRVLSQMMFKALSLLFCVSFAVVSHGIRCKNLFFYIELVVVTVVGAGEDVENSADPCWDAGFWFSTGLLRDCG